MDEPAAALPVLLDDGNRRYVYGAGGLAYVASSLGTVDVVHADGLGSVRALTDAGAQVVQTYAADEYGLPTESQGSRRQPVQWAGEERDEQGLVFLRARSYDPATGRFLQADPLRQSGPGITGWNRYAYATNNPVNWVDPSGLCVDPATVVDADASIRYCIETFIWQREVWGFLGDERRPSASSGDAFRTRQFIYDQGGVPTEYHRAGVSRLAAEVPGIRGLEREADLWFCGWRVKARVLDGGRRIAVTCSASDALLFGLAPPARYVLAIAESAQGEASVVSAWGTPFPSLEVWQYGRSPDPILVFAYNSGNHGPLDLFRMEAFPIP